jgi:hypothetical protein
MRRPILILGALALTGLMAACAGDGSLASQVAAKASRLAESSSDPAASAASTPPDGSSPETYCTDKGGMLVPRVATWNTNADPSQWLELAGRWTLCEFESGEGDSATRISVDLTTLSSTEPTLASVAYLAAVPASPTDPPGSNPGTSYCVNDLDGSSSFGNTAAGGGWVDQSQPVFVVMDLCVFADGSAIDEFGLFYHSDGTIRGADLAPLFAYQPGEQLPAIYDAARR